MRQFVLLLSGLFVFGVFALPSAHAHKFFKEELEKKYEADNLKVKSCNFCHVAKKPKTERNDLGKLFEKDPAFDGKDFSAKLKKAHDADNKAEEEALEAEMIKAFKKAMEEIEKKSPEKDGPTYAELIKEKKLEYLEEKGEGEDDDK